MSDDRQTNVKRGTPMPTPVTESMTAVGALETAAAALPPPEPTVSLPAPVPEPARDTDRCFAAYRAALSSIGESQAAVASDVTAMALEMSGLARANLTVAGDSVTAFLRARSLVDVVEAQLGFARRSLDALAGGSTRLGEIGLRLASDAAKPMVHPFAA